MGNSSLLSCATMLLVATALPAVAQPTRIVGTVFSETGEPIKGASVVADSEERGPCNCSTTTDSHGRFLMFTSSAAGLWRVMATAPGFVPSEVTLQIAALRQSDGIEFRLVRGVKPAGRPLAGVDFKAVQHQLDAAQSAWSAGDIDAAINGWRALLIKAPALTHLRLQIAEALHGKQDLAGSAASYRDLLTIEPANAEALNGLGTLALEQQQPQEAEGFFRKASAADPAWTAPMLQLGLLALDRGDKATAAEEMRSVLAVDPTGPDAVRAKEVLEKLGKD